MGLGGMTRDSIVGLDQLGGDEDDDIALGTTNATTTVARLPARRHRSGGRTAAGGGLGGSWHGGGDKDRDSLLLAVVVDDDGEPSSPCCPSDFETSLNDGLGGSAAAASSATTMATTTIEASTTTAPSPSPSPPRVSATNSRSLDSYRSADTSATSNLIVSPTNKYTNNGGGGRGGGGGGGGGFQYEGFYADYYSEDYAYGSFDSYDVGGNDDDDDNRQRGNAFCCLFAPWTAHRREAIAGEEVASSSATKDDAVGTSDVVPVVATTSVAPETAVATEESSPPSSPSALPPDAKTSGDSSSSSPVVVEGGMEHTPSPSESPSKGLHPGAETPKFTKPLVVDDEDKVVNALLTPILADQTMTTTSTTSLSQSSSSVGFDEKKQEEDDDRRVIEGDVGDKDKDGGGPPPIKGILKVRICSAAKLNGKNDDGKKKAVSGAGASSSAPSPAGRKLFPTYEPKRSAGRGGDGVDGEGRSIDFNPMARVLTIPSRRDLTLHHRAQVWWQKCDYDEFKKTGRIISKAMECGGSEVWLTSSNAWGNRAARAAEGGVRGGTASGDAGKKRPEGGGKKDDAPDYGNKWWCKFGHSRRGLEHVVSVAEGRERQQSVLLASRMVLEEQRRQRASRTKDPNKLRNVAMQYTSWARDLALAAGSADAEAVSNNFDALGSPWGGSRARHFARRAGAAGGGGAASLVALLLGHPDGGGGGGENVVVGGGARVAAAAVTSQILDANTHVAAVPPRTSSIASTSATSAASKAKSSTTTRDPGAVDQDHSSEGVSLKKRAKGFMPGGGDEVASMMGGMGGMGFRSVKA